MARKLSPVYYLIPVIYIAVILFFVFMQFQSKQDFQASVGNLSLSGAYVQALGGGRRLKTIELRFHNLRMHFSRSSALLGGFGPVRQNKLLPETFSQFPEGFEIEFNDGFILRFVVEGPLGDRVRIIPILPQSLGSLRNVSLPYTILQGDQEPVRGIPELEATGPAGTVFVSLPEGSEIDTGKGRLTVNLEAAADGEAIVLERILNKPQPYLHWFSQDFPLVGSEELESQVRLYLNRSYQYWSSVLASAQSSQQLVGDLGIALVSEAIKRGEYRRFLAVVARNIRQFLLENSDNPSVYQSAAYLGNLPAFLSHRQEAAAAEIERITALIKAADFSVLETPDLICFIINHAPFSLVEEVLRLADSARLEQQTLYTLLHLTEVYLDAIRFLDVGNATYSRAKEIVDRFILPSIRKTPRGLFLAASISADQEEIQLYESVRAGGVLMRAGELLAQDSYVTLGGNLIHSALRLADSEGFIPTRLRIQGQEIEPGEELLAPERIYSLLPTTRYTPREYPLYSYLYPGSWIWTASLPGEIKIDEQQYRFFFSFPTGGTHYLLIQGIRPMQSVVMHGIPWKSDPQYFQYTDGWAYDADNQTLYVKITHRTQTEEIVLNY